MPWTGERNPYRVWLSEVILQQTRVDQGLAYYQRFVAAFDTIEQLAQAPDERVFKLWEGLGYYSRCRNMLATARFVAKQLNGQFPCTYSTILALQGVGPYTAAAIASFAFGLPYAVVDGNVLRVLARFWGIALPVDEKEGRRQIEALAQELLYTPDPGAYNQAIMDFGATICKPQQPLCGQCPLHVKCMAYRQGMVAQLPVKAKRLVKKNRWLTYIIFKMNNNVWIRTRQAKDIWQHLNEFYLLEHDKQQVWDEELAAVWLAEKGVAKATVAQITPVLKQQLTHQTIHGQFIIIHVKQRPVFLENYRQVNVHELGQAAFPRLINTFLETYNIN